MKLRQIHVAHLAHNGVAGYAHADITPVAVHRPVGVRIYGPGLRAAIDGDRGIRSQRRGKRKT